MEKSSVRTIGRLECRLLKLVLRLWFELRYRKHHAKLCLEKMGDLNLLVPPEVFNPKLFGSSSFLFKYLLQHPIPPGIKVLDLGCGSGLLGIQLARRGARVIATDINPEAVWATAVNAQLNACQPSLEVRQGSLFAPVAAESEKFDLVVLNPPYYAGIPDTPLEQAFRAGPALEVLTAMLAGTCEVLKPQGRALAVLSSTIPLAHSWKAVEEVGLSWQPVAQRRYWAEWHLIYEIRPAKSTFN
ncbi:MAG TPA: methyltransferase [Chloroflexia bacterium]|nr:methyltransferase [Chloroflexia bacterium]